MIRHSLAAADLIASVDEARMLLRGYQLAIGGLVVLVAGGTIGSALVLAVGALAMGVGFLYHAALSSRVANRLRGGRLGGVGESTIGMQWIRPDVIGRARTLQRARHTSNDQ